MQIVIFDMDGVIFDSERAVYEEWKALSEKYGFSDLEIPYWDCIGVNATRAEQIFKNFYGEDFPFKQYAQEKSDNYHRKYSGGRIPMKKGVRELLTYLKENGYYVAIASSTRTAVVEDQIEAAGLLWYFDRFVGGDQIAKSKPEPDIFLKAVEGLDVDIREVFVIEDSYNGIRAAKRAGMRPIMVPDMLMPTDEMEELAEVILKDLCKVKEYLETNA